MEKITDGGKKEKKEAWKMKDKMFLWRVWQKQAQTIIVMMVPQPGQAICNKERVVKND